MKAVKISILLLGLLASINGITQGFTENMANKLDSFVTGYPQEKVFLHTDKNNYIAGETIWFKAYVVLESKPTYLSKVVYVDVTNDRGVIVEKRMFPLQAGVSHGDVLLKKELPAGNYTISCYTLWMLNFPEFIFQKPFYIFNTDYSSARAATAGIPDFSIQFMPEGGDAVAGLPGRIAFKAIGKNGLPVPVTGDVFDSRNKKIVSFAALHDGMGMFELTPLAGENYTVAVTAATGARKSVSLPPVKQEGITLQVVNDNPNRLFVQLQRSETNKNKYNTLLVIAQLNNEIFYTGEINFDEGKQAAAIPKKTLPPGIVQITVMTRDSIQLAERLAFISNYDAATPPLSIDTLSFTARKKNQFSIDLSSYKNSRASVSITNYAADTSLYNENILSSLLLTSDLKGYVHNPGFYFRDKESATLQALDLLLMTQGWRRFEWKKLLRDQYPVLRYPVESGISIAGTLTNVNGKGLESGRMDFIIKGEDSTTILSTAKANEKNQFVIGDLDFRKNATVYYQGTNTKNSTALTRVTLYPFFYDTLSRRTRTAYINNDPFASLSAITERLLAEKMILDKAEGKVLGEVVVKAKKLLLADSLSKEYASELFSMSDQNIAMDKMNYFSIWQFLQRSVAGINIGKNDVGQTTVFFNRYMNLDPIPSETLDPDISIDNTTNIAFFLNEVPVSKDLIESLDPSEVALVKVWKGPSAGVLGASNGAIAIYTQKGKSGKDWRDKGFDFFKKEGYSVVREYYTTDYSVLDPASSFADIRETLYWNPVIKTNNAGKARLVFYNDDLSKSFKVCVQGIDENGKLFSIEKIIR